VNRTVLTALILLLPVLLVLAIRQSSYGPVLATPQYRQEGPSSAKVTIVEYSDFQCPSCARVQPQLKEWMQSYQGKVRLIFKHYPLTTIHRHAVSAAVAAECAGHQQLFWDYADRLYTNQSQWAPLMDATTHYTTLAGDLGLNMDRFNACRADLQTTATILKDEQEAKSRGVNATPTFFIGEQQLVGQVFLSDGAQAIERALRQ